MRERAIRRRAAVTLLRSVRNRHALARHPLVREACAGTTQRQDAQRRVAFADELPSIITLLLNGLSSESDQQRRRLSVLRRSDIERENHTAIAHDMSLSRSQFYRDLREARDLFTEALGDRLALRTSGYISLDASVENDPRFVAMDALRDSGQFERALAASLALARDCNDAARAIRALCLCADLQIELGAFAETQRTIARARALLPAIPDDRWQDILGANCDLVELEAAHCQGTPGVGSARRVLIEHLRYGYSRDRRYTEMLVRALIEQASILFDQGDDVHSLEIIEEASSIVARERLADTRLAVDVAIRSSGIRALRADQVSRALEETSKIVEAGSRNRDVRSLRLGMQMMSAHLLTLGRFEEAKHFALESWGLIDLFGSTLDRLIVLSNLARIEIHRRDGRAALEWIDMARALRCEPFSISQALAISEAEALALLEQPGRAAEMAHMLGIRVGNWPRLLGRAKLAEATALAALNRTSEARVQSMEAVELSRLAGGPLLHLRSLDLYIKLGGDSASRSAFRDLRATLNPHFAG
jgi:hypothetical protein